MMETLTQAMARLRAEGYVEDFSASDSGELQCGRCGARQAPEHMSVDITVRFEGDSNPDDEAILLALSCEGGDRGLYASAFGADTPPADAQVLRRLARRDRS